MNPAAASRLAKERHPENYCADPRCLWRVKHAGTADTPCPTHAALAKEGHVVGASSPKPSSAAVAPTNANEALKTLAAWPTYEEWIAGSRSHGQGNRRRAGSSVAATFTKPTKDDLADFYTKAVEMARAVLKVQP